MWLSCECHGVAKAYGPEKVRIRQYSSKKCNCPYKFRVYCFEHPTKVVDKEDVKDSIILRFLPGVYIYEYPFEDHTCNTAAVKLIVDEFENEQLYSHGLPSTVSKYSETSTEKLWDQAMVLYEAAISQDQAFLILGKLGIVFIKMKIAY